MFGSALMRAIVFMGVMLLFVLGAPIAAISQDVADFWEHRWIYIRPNLFMSGEAARVNAIITRAANVGFNGVVISTSILDRQWRTSAGPAWHDRMLAVRQHAADSGMDFTLGVLRLGRSMLTHDPALVAGYPIRNMPLQRIGNELVPLSTAKIENGSFENHIDNEFDGWRWQALPGVRSFADSVETVSGRYSIRFEIAEGNHSAVWQTLDVVPFQQYRLKAWFKTENLTADWLGIIVQRPLADNNGISSRLLSYPSPHGDGTERSYESHLHGADDLTLGWTEETLSFNSQDETELDVAFGARGHGGKIWWDDIRIDVSPTLNVIRRAGLPLTIVGADGFVYTEGVDFHPISDPKLGTVIWPGNYGTHHTPPRITVPAGSRIGSGEEVYFSGYHTILAQSGAPYASMTDAGVFNVIDTVISEAEAAFYPDGYLINYSEIRTGGWEPDQIANYSSSGEVLAASIAEAVNRVDTLTGYKPLHVWSDMFNPYQNAVEHYYHINNTLEGSWLGLPMSLGIMNWTVSEQGQARGRAALQFFEGRGHEQIIAAYYDENVIENYRGWMAAADGLRNVTGVLYTTWEDDYTDLELFARTWWDGGRN